MFEIKQEFVGIAYGIRIHDINLHLTLYNVFCRIVDKYEEIKFYEQELCTDLFCAIKECLNNTYLTLPHIEGELIFCINKEVPLNELELSVYGTTDYFDEINEKLKNNKYIKG